MLAGRGRNIFVDENLYPVARWGVERAAAEGAIVRSFSHHDPGALRAAMAGARASRPVVVTDGFCPACGLSAPLADYVECAAAEGGLVVVDDTQALGIFGRSPDASPPYGSGGGGSLGRLAKGRDAVVILSSLAKAFGTPLAMLGGPAALIARFRESSATRMHCSPPSAAVLAAARMALERNRRCGDLLRGRLAERVARFRRGLNRLALLGVPGYFPVQPLRLPDGASPGAVYAALLRSGVRPVLQRPARGAPARVSFVFTAQHRLSEIGMALEVLARALPRGSFEILKGAKFNGI
jgi:8-amino-7-oxononanoate synthase